MAKGAEGEAATWWVPYAYCCRCKLASCLNGHCMISLQIQEPKLLGVADIPETVLLFVMEYLSVGGIRLAAASRSCQRSMVLPLFRVLESHCVLNLAMMQRLDLVGQTLVTLANGKQITCREYDMHVAAWAIGCLSFYDQLSDRLGPAICERSDNHFLHLRLLCAIEENQVARLCNRVNERLGRLDGCVRRQQALLEATRVSMMRALSYDLLPPDFLPPPCQCYYQVNSKLPSGGWECLIFGSEGPWPLLVKGVCNGYFELGFVVNSRLLFSVRC